MTNQEINRNCAKIQDLLLNHKLFEAFKLIKSFSEETNSDKFVSEIEAQSTTYRYMLDYYAKGIDDPHKTEVLNGIICSLFTILDKISIELQMASDSSFSNARRVVANTAKSLGTLIEEYRNRYDALRLIDDGNEKEQLRKDCENLEATIFKFVWTAFPMRRDETEIAADAINSDEMPSYTKELIISALFLGTYQYFDERKTDLLLNIYENDNNPSSIRMKSLVALFFIIAKHSKRFRFSRRLNERLQLQTDRHDFFTDLKLVMLQFIQCRDTERITRKLRDELLPELMKLTEKSKISLKKLGITSIEDLEANPEWQKEFDKGFGDKIKEFSEMQIEGSDVMMSTFAHLKSFPFFNETSNWFLPFHAENSACGIKGDKSTFIDIIASPMMTMCSNDKYSLVLTLASLPESQREAASSQFAGQYEQYREMMEGEGKLTTDNNKLAIAEYMQDLYRFFKLHPRKTEWNDPFSAKPQFASTPLLSHLNNDAETLRTIASFYFKREYYAETIESLEALLSISESSAEIYEQLGFCCQNLKRFGEAIEYYDRALIFSGDKVWTLRHLAFCHKTTGNFDKALKLYQRAETLQPENVAIILNIGHILLETGMTAEALKHYYKADYLSPSKHRAWRPIAWCEFILGNYTQSQNYYNKIISEDNSTAQDYLNFGHLNLVLNKKAECFDCYNKSIAMLNGDIHEFEMDFMSDSETLAAKGVSSEDIAITLDLLKFGI